MFMENFNLEIKDFGKINDASIEINKINVVGGVNASGKSTASKLLYCYLKAIILNRNINSLNVSDLPVDYFNEARMRLQRKMNDDDSKDNSENNLIKILGEKDSDSLFSFLMTRCLSSESILFIGGFHKFYSNSFECYKDEKSVFKIKSLEETSNNSLEMSNNFNEVFYFDTSSIFAFNSPSEKYFNHILDLNDALSNKNDLDDDKNIKIREIEYKIGNIIQGKIKGEDIFFSFVSSNDSQIQLKNISSGMKQIAVIQLLLQNNRLLPDSFLIVDEPEVNLHPTWQFKFAEILVLLARELNITIYLNSHSPMFIESIDAFTEFYDMENEINYYLTEESEVEGKYNFTKIKSNELYKLYDNLGNGYKLINKLRLRKRLNK